MCLLNKAYIFCRVILTCKYIMPFHNAGPLTHVTCKSSCANEIKKVKSFFLFEVRPFVRLQKKINKAQKDSMSWQNYLHQYKKNWHFKSVLSTEKVNP